MSRRSCSRAAESITYIPRTRAGRAGAGRREERRAAPDARRAARGRHFTTNAMARWAAVEKKDRTAGPLAGSGGHRAKEPLSYLQVLLRQTVPSPNPVDR